MFFFGQRASDAGAANGAAVVPVQVTAATASSVGDVVVVVVVVGTEPKKTADEINVGLKGIH